jgi:hypothetical protein
MKLDVDNDQIRVRLSPISNQRSRLMIDFPREPRYRDAVLKALAHLLLQPPPPLPETE